MSRQYHSVDLLAHEDFNGHFQLKFSAKGNVFLQGCGIISKATDSNKLTKITHQSCEWVKVTLRVIPREFGKGTGITLRYDYPSRVLVSYGSSTRQVSLVTCKRLFGCAPKPYEDVFLALRVSRAQSPAQKAATEARKGLKVAA